MTRTDNYAMDIDLFGPPPDDDDLDVEEVPTVAEAARMYARAGWSPIPVAATKEPAASGVSGYRGKYLTEADLGRYRWDVNIGLRLPPDVVGVDLDVYYGGNEGLAELEAKYGTLPRTVRSTSRTDGSGIALYRVPNGTTLQTKPARGVDMIQWFHRHATVWPSRHPETGRVYRWLDLLDEPVDGPLPIDEMPELPWSWVAGLAMTKGAAARAALPSTCREFIDKHTENTRPAALGGVMTKLAEVETGGRHDGLVAAACWAMREAAAGLYPAQEAIDRLREWWCRAVADNPARLPDDDDGGEFGAAIAWAIGQANADPERIDAIRTKNVDELSALAAPPADVDPETGEISTSTTSRSDDLEHPGLTLESLGPVVSGAIVRPEPTVLRRSDGQSLLYPGVINGVHADSGVGKSWLALAACAEQMRAGRNVIYLDAEDTAASIVSRLRTLGARDSEIIERLDYYRPDERLELFDVHHLVERITERNTSLVVIDSLGELFALHGIDENSDAEVGPMIRNYLRPLADAGPAVLLLDHITKSNDVPLHASGSKRKRAAIGGASYFAYATKPLAADRGGRVNLVCAKDRHGWYARSETVATFAMDIHPDGRTSWHLYAAGSTAPDVLPIERAARAAIEVVAKSEEPVPLRVLRGQMEVKASNATKEEGIALAVFHGDLVETNGPRNARLFALPPLDDESPASDRA